MGWRPAAIRFLASATLPHRPNSPFTTSKNPVFNPRKQRFSSSEIAIPSRHFRVFVPECPSQHSDFHSSRAPFSIFPHSTLSPFAQIIGLQKTFFPPRAPRFPASKQLFPVRNLRFPVTSAAPRPCFCSRKTVSAIVHAPISARHKKRVYLYVGTGKKCTQSSVRVGIPFGRFPTHSI